MARRNGTLDILRALAIVLVVNCHIVSTFDLQGSVRLLQVGGKGVDLFFVLSGWLLGRQLLKELRDTGSLKIRRFWYRRWWRTLPAYYAVLFMTIAWQIAGGHLARFDWRFLGFAQNYELALPYFGVSWSLCVEEHFYVLVAPALLCFWRFRVLRPLFAGVLLLPLACRLLHLFGATHETHVRYDQCAVGVCLAGVEMFGPSVWRALCRHAELLALSALCALAHPVLLRMGLYTAVGDYDCLVYSLLFGAFVILANSSAFYVDRCRSQVATYVAERAYALYLMHPEALALAKRLPSLPPTVRFAVVWALSLVCAELLYRTIERPFMRLRDRMPALATTGGASTPTPVLPNAYGQMAAPSTAG